MLEAQISPGTSVPDSVQLAVPQDDQGCSALVDVKRFVSRDSLCR